MKIDALAVLSGLLLVSTASAQQFTYDALGQLTSIRYDGTRLITYQADLAGNTTNLAVSAAQAETDADGDAMPDAWEWVYFNSLSESATNDFNQDTRSNLDHYLNQTDPAAPDTDGDGASNLDERTAGTNPLDPASVFELLLARPVVSGFALSWHSVTGKRYWVDRAASSPTATWSRVAGPFMDTSPMNVYTDTPPAGPVSWWFRIGAE